MTLEEYRIRHSILIEQYQWIEFDLEGLYAAVSDEPFCEALREIEKDSIGGVVREINLCGYCAAEEGYNSIGHNSLAGMLASMLGEVTSSHLASKSTRCAVCGSDFSDIAQTGKVGCAECYKTFIRNYCLIQKEFIQAQNTWAKFLTAHRLPFCQKPKRLIL